jgi:hypothetical protein
MKRGFTDDNRAAIWKSHEDILTRISFELGAEGLEHLFYFPLVRNAIQFVLLLVLCFLDCFLRSIMEWFCSSFV